MPPPGQGARGVALFFRSHECNPLCHKLKLKPFARWVSPGGMGETWLVGAAVDLTASACVCRCESDVKAQGYASESSSTLSQGGTIARKRTFRRNR